jgi:histidinol dehydrogenase
MISLTTTNPAPANRDIEARQVLEPRKEAAVTMPLKLATSAAGFEAAFAGFLTTKREVSANVDAVVAGIIASVRAKGDAALVALSAEHDKVDLAKVGLRVGPGEIAAAVAGVERETRLALELARDRIASHHARQKPVDDNYRDAIGAELGSRWTAVESVGLYVPGGLASYPSSVLMNAVPAQVAGVPRVVMVVPAPRGELNPLVLVAAHLAGVEEIYRVGGAQAVAALAYGTQTIAPVVKIVGPGNAYVAAAKRQVFGHVGIDSIAGPSEVLVIADKDNDPEWIAADLLAQAEHDTAAQAILMTDDEDFARAVEQAVGRQLAVLPRGNIAGESWNEFGAVILLRSLEEAPALADRIAAEHLEITTRDPDALAVKIRNAGAIFLGAYTPEVIGDYVAGSNHVLPTARSARFASGLGVLDFMKRTSMLRLDAAALAHLAPAAMALARAEGLEAHRRSVEIRAGRARG